MRWTAVLLLGLLAALPVGGQAGEEMPLDVPITLGTMTGDTITEAALYDWWIVFLNEGDTIRVEMQGYNGLAPLVGILSEERATLARSDAEGDAPPNGLAALEFRAQQTGEYRIVTSRAGGAGGTTTGTYTVLATLVSAIPARVNTAPESQFRCGDMVINNALTLRFSEDVDLEREVAPGDPIEMYTLTAASFGRLEPAVRVVSETIGVQLDCTRDAAQVPGTVFTLPGEPELTVTDAARAVQLSAVSTSREVLLGDLVWTLGALEGTTGRYVVVLSGRSILSRIAPDSLIIQRAPRAQHTALTVYMISDKNSRLDPYLILTDEAGNPLLECDDAGSRACPDVPTARGLMIRDAQGRVVVEGGRFDAGLRIPADLSGELRLLLTSRNLETTGPYALVVVAEFE